MKTYTVLLNFRISPNLASAHAQYDEQLRIIMAESKEEAFSKACRMGLAEEASLNGSPVRWIFLGVSAIDEFVFEDGTQIDSRTVIEDNPELYERNVRQKMKDVGAVKKLVFV